MLPDFSTRSSPASLPEWMDQPCTYADFRACLVDLAQVNRVTQAARPTLAWLDSLPGQPAPLRILDVGCGGGDTLRRIAKWAVQRNRSVDLTGIDLNPHATRAACEFAAPGESIRFITGDAYTYQTSNTIDVVISSLLMHHLEAPEIIRFLKWMESVAAVGWFVNDLSRAAVPFVLFTALSRLARWHRFVQHDGPVSIRRGFRPADWQSLCAEAGVSGTHIQGHSPGRLCVERIK